MAPKPGIGTLKISLLIMGQVPNKKKTSTCSLKYEYISREKFMALPVTQHFGSG
jgi:hypothetical protein